MRTTAAAFTSPKATRRSEEPGAIEEEVEDDGKGKSHLITKGGELERQDTDFPLLRMLIDADGNETEHMPTLGGGGVAVQPLILNELCEYNLYILRHIYDAFE
jgi:hypothetical protein